MDGDDTEVSRAGDEGANASWSEARIAQPKTMLRAARVLPSRFIFEQQGRRRESLYADEDARRG
jgi:hypothetical protein